MHYEGNTIQQKDHWRSCLMIMYFCIIDHFQRVFTCSFTLFNNKPRKLSKTNVTSHYLRKQSKALTWSASHQVTVARTRNSTSCLEVHCSCLLFWLHTSPYDLGKVTWHFFVIVSSSVKQGEYSQYLAKVTWEKANKATRVNILWDVPMQGTHYQACLVFIRKNRAQGAKTLSK